MVLKGQAAIKWASPTAGGLSKLSLAALAELRSARLRGQAAIKCPSGTTRSLRGQAAMEYLVTYGWALLALIVVLAALASSGIFSPSRFISEECNFQPNLPCSPFILYTSSDSSTLEFSVQNGLGFPIKFTGVNASFASGGVSPASLSTTSSIINDGEKYSVKLDFPSSLPKGSSQTLYVQLHYINCLSASAPNCDATSGEYTSSGRIVATVQQSS